MPPDIGREERPDLVRLYEPQHGPCKVCDDEISIGSVVVPGDVVLAWIHHHRLGPEYRAYDHEAVPHDDRDDAGTDAGRNGIEVTQGQVVLNSAGVIRESDSLIVLEADCRTKRCWPSVSYSFLGGVSHPPEVHLLPADDSVLLDDSTDVTTVIRLPARCAGWHVIAESAKYTVRIAAWDPAGYERVWAAEAPGRAVRPENSDVQQCTSEA